MGDGDGELMEELFSIQAYGVLGYSMTMALAIACAGVGIAFFRAGRDRFKSGLFAASAFLFAMLFGYLVLVSIELPWLNRNVTQPIMRTVSLGAAGCGWAYLILMLRKEARLNGTTRRPPPETTNATQGGD